MRITSIHGQALILSIVSAIDLSSTRAASLQDLETFKVQYQKLRADVPEKEGEQAPLPASSDAQIHTWLTTQQPDGSWTDINYKDNSLAAWRTLDHLRRVQGLAMAFVRNEAQGKNDPALLHGIVNGLNYWNMYKFVSRNWFNQTIGTPQLLSTILVLMDGHLPPEVRAESLKIIGNPGKRGGGANLVWIESTRFKTASLSGDLAAAQEAHEIILKELHTTTKEGIQPDESYHFHGSQQQFGNYGLGFFGEMTEWAAAWRGTSFAFSERQMEELRNFALQGEALVVANGVMDISSCGRQLGSPRVTASKGKTLLNHLNLLVAADPAHADAYRAAIAQDSAPAGAGAALNRLYYRSDYLVQRRPDYFATLKMCSKRVEGGESINGENLRGHFLAHGALFLYQTGNEYMDIQPVWDWHRIPGVTCRTGGPLHGPGKVEIDFAGGVSDGNCGACGFNYNQEGVTGKKAWFFFDHQVICLGAGLNSTNAEPIGTTVEQSLLTGPVSAASGQGAGQPLPSGEQHLSDAKWVWHNNRGYYFPQPQKVVERNAAQTGDWNVVRSGATAEGGPITKQVFSLWLDHGAHLANEAYSYVILPAVSVEQAAAYAAHPQMLILANTDSVQAVKDTGLELTAAVFYAAGTVQTSVGPLAADGPCAVLLRKGAQGYNLTVADPTHSDTKLTVTLGGRALNVGLPQGDTAGSSVAVALR